MEAICDRTNLNQAYRRVKANKGAAGVDGQTVDDLRIWLATHRDKLIASLLDGTYQPTAVRAVKIPKASGGSRQLGIPSVLDRLVQQAILQVLGPILDPTFSPSSFGFRPGKSAHDALLQAKSFVEGGRWIVVDIDLESFFDRVNHDILMSRLTRHVGDKRLQLIIRRFLTAGMMEHGVVVRREEGTPQGGPLSPLLANLILDDLDKDLERRGHQFCRYADDCNIYVSSRRSGERVMSSVSKFLEERLKLRVNRAKSAVAPVRERKFLGYRLSSAGGLSAAPQSMERFKLKLRWLTGRRARGQSFEETIRRLNEYVRGWVQYFRLGSIRSQMVVLDHWLRHRLRSLRLRQCKRAYPIAKFLSQNGVPEWRAWILASSGKGWWRLGGSPSAMEAMTNVWFERLGLIGLAASLEAVKI
jgi:RNA-directed DNA polymerase